MEVGSIDRLLTLAARPDAAPEPARGSEDTTKIREAASQFEALLLAKMLKSVREAAGDGWLGAGGDEAGGMMLDVAQEHLAQVLASQGGLGLANMVTEGLSRTGKYTSTPKLPGPGCDKMS
jgi:Rod binding domain-containing protein